MYAIALKAPNGASLMIQPTIMKNKWLRRSTCPNSAATKRVWSGVFSAKAETVKTGMMLSRNLAVGGIRHCRFCGHDLEVDESLDADAPHRFQIADVGDPDHYGAEDDRRDQHFDQFDGPVGKGFAVRAKFRPQPADETPMTIAAINCTNSDRYQGGLLASRASSLFGSFTAVCMDENGRSARLRKNNSRMSWM